MVLLIQYIVYFQAYRLPFASECTVEEKTYLTEIILTYNDDNKCIYIFLDIAYETHQKCTCTFSFTQYAVNTNVVNR